MSVGFRKLGSSVLDVLTKRRVPIGAKGFAGSVAAFQSRGSILALLVRLKCLTCSSARRYICVPGGRVQGRCTGTISMSS